ncbi:thioesterase [Actinomycetes bacterium]|nr:thioesterase [Actinomycetes bacterium]
MRHTAKVHVRWDDLDAFGHINNAKYLTYVQEARADFTWFARQAAGKTPLLFDMVVARAEVDYIEPIYDGGMDVDCQIWITRIGNASFEMEYEIIHKGVIRARVKTTQVAVSVETKRSRPLSDEEREFLAEYLEEPK